MNYAKDRISNDIKPTFPSKDVPCKDCKYRLGGLVGYRNRYCDIYQDRGKPQSILYEGDDCAFHEEE